MRKLIFLFTLLLPFGLLAQHAGTVMSFGKNRVQNKPFVWSVLKTNRFDVYYYLDGQELARFVTRLGDELIKQTEDQLNYRIADRYQIILYNRLSDLQQTNLNIDLDQYNAGGMARLYDNKILVHFNGNREDFVRELRRGIARVLLFDMIYGGTLQERLSAAAVNPVPEWYLNGLLNYIFKPWSVEQDDAMRNLIQSRKFKFYSEVLEANPTLAGQAVWYYLGKKFGPNAVQQAIFLTRIYRRAEPAIFDASGITLNELLSDCLMFFKATAQEDARNRAVDTTELNIASFGKNVRVTQLKRSPDGLKVAAVTHKNGISSIVVVYLESGKKEVVFRNGIRNSSFGDFQPYPVISWKNDNKTIAFFYEKEGDMTYAESKLKEFREPTDIPRESPLGLLGQVSAFSFFPDGRRIVISAGRKGQGDLFTWDLVTLKLTALTNDAWDDRDPIVLDQGRKILFSSNRPADTLSNQGADSLGIYGSAYDLYLFYPGTNKKLTRATSTPGVDEIRPFPLPGNKFGFLSNQNGFYNRGEGTIDSVSEMIDTNLVWKDVVSWKMVTDLPFNLIDAGAGQSGRTITALYMKSSKPKLIVSKDRTAVDSLRPTIFRQYSQTLDLARLDTAWFNRVLQGSGAVDSGNSTKFIVTKPFIEWLDALPLRDDDSLGIKQFVYSPLFSLDYYGSTVQSMSSLPFLPNFLISKVNQITTKPVLMMMASASDIFQDYKITGGAFSTSDFNNRSVFLNLEDNKNRLDKSYTLFQNQYVTQQDQTNYRVNTVEAMAQFSYALRPTFRLVASGIAKREAFNVLTVDLRQLLAPGSAEYWVGGRLDAVYDNSIQRQPNILFGTRGRAFIELDGGVTGKLNSLAVAGFDVRDYRRLYKEIIWANRAAFNTSFGAKRMLYYMGGVDGWLRPSFNTLLNPPSAETFAFSALANNMRGFDVNVRNGSKYAVFNSELRIPVVSTLSNRVIKRDFFKSLMLVGFVDCGTAWSGFSPWSSTNPFNQKTYSNGTSYITVFTRRNPILFGTGMGVRCRIYGFNLRADYARGREDGKWLPKGRWYVSIGLDF